MKKSLYWFGAGLVVALLSLLILMSRDQAETTMLLMVSAATLGFANGVVYLLGRLLQRTYTYFVINMTALSISLGGFSQIVYESLKNSPYALLVWLACLTIGVLTHLSLAGVVDRRRAKNS